MNGKGTRNNAAQIKTESNIMSKDKETIESKHNKNKPTHKMTKQMEKQNKPQT